MTTTLPQPRATDDTPSQVNNFALKLANVNGTGSASANALLMQAIFRMGIPVSGKNLFPSNIQGLPTWYEIRVNKSGYTARALDYDLMVAMNSQTYGEDIKEVASGGYVLYDSSWPLESELLREDVTFLGVPLARMCLENFSSSRERVLMKNIAYTGALVALLDIDLEVIATLLTESYARNEKLLTSNQKALRLGYEYARENFECPLGFHVAPMDETAHSILIDGNTASALGCLYAGATVAGWYPITPATALMDNFSALCAKFRREPVDSVVPGAPDSFHNNYLILQAEDEIAAIGMVLGASWSGARSFTSTSGPGISLMSELLGLAYYTEIPAVIFDVQRTGPSTGMPTRTQQADILLCAYASHGDTKHILLFPANPHECFEFAVASFDIAERFQTPVFVLSDLDIGMNDWVVPELTWDDDFVPDRGRVLDDQDLSEIAEFFRYTNEDADFVTPRTVPGSHEKGSYFIRGSGHDKFGKYTEVPAEYQEVVDRLKKKHAAARHAVPAPVVIRRPSATVGIITLGSCDLAVREAIDELADTGIIADYLRVRGFPFVESVREFIEEHPHCFVVEQNRDGQLRSLLAIETQVDINLMHSVLQYGGFPLSASHVVEAVTARLEDHSWSPPTKPLIPLAVLPKNELGLTVRDYEGAMSTLCAGCGHDSVTAAITQMFFELSMPPRDIAKLSGIGCSSKTPTYFVRGAHGFNSAHGRMATIATGANAANRELTYIGISGDGDSLSIGIGHLSHLMRRNVNMVYVLENNGVYGLTKGQFSASADIGSRSKRGVSNVVAPIDPIMLGLSMGATFLARSFSGDKEQLIPLLKAAVAHQGMALIDVISPCVTFNDHEGSTKSYRFMREHEVKEIETDFVPWQQEISMPHHKEDAREIIMHDGSSVRFRSVPDGYDPRDRQKVEEYIRERHERGEIATGLLYVNEDSSDVHEMNNTPEIALAKVPFSKLCPGSTALMKLQEDFR